jgi:hypothetical protein
MMESNFHILLSATRKERPPVSYKVREYFEQFVTENILKRKKIIIGGSWTIRLTIYFLTKGPKVRFKGVALSKGATTVTREATKLYGVLILIEPIMKSPRSPVKND